MTELTGKYGTAIVYNDLVEEKAMGQIILLLNQPMAKDAHVRVMPDVHFGAGCVIGYTARITDKIVPNLVGVDIGCEVLAICLGKQVINFEDFDNYIREFIPSGQKVRDTVYSQMSQAYADMHGLNFSLFQDEVEEICLRTGQSVDRAWYSLGSLGGGNHFIELDQAKDGTVWLLIHSGSRQFGQKVALLHQRVAKNEVGQVSYDSEIKKIVKKYKGTAMRGARIQTEIAALKASRSDKVSTGLEYLEGDLAKNYFDDMFVAQEYAQLNCHIMARVLLDWFGLEFSKQDKVESVHNYISPDDNIIRKGAISARAGDRVVIPLNMAEGVILGVGKGNPEWNISAPHGAGRMMSRTKAKAELSLDEFKAEMEEKGVWSSSIGKATLDEAPRAYKDSQEIIDYLTPTVEITHRLKPIYNWKST